jgi:hypothetical protein
MESTWPIPKSPSRDDVSIPASSSRTESRGDGTRSQGQSSQTSIRVDQVVRPNPLPLYQCIFALPNHFPIPPGNRVYSSNYPRLPERFIPAETPDPVHGALVTNAFVELRFFDVVAQPGEDGVGPAEILVERLWPDADLRRSGSRSSAPTTVICATTPRLALEERDKSQPLQDACVERVIREAGLLLDSYGLMKNDFRQSAISLFTLLPVVFARILNGDGTAQPVFIQLLPGAFPHARPTLTEHEMEGLLTWRKNILDQQPFTRFIRFTTSARRSLFHHGDPSAAVVQAQTAAEVLLNSVLRLSLLEKGVSEHNIGVVMNSRFKDRVTRDLARLLGGDWQLAGAGPVATWWAQTYMLRNRVVHEGTDATAEEARAAMAAVKELENFVNDRLVAQLHSYRVAAILKFGLPGLGRRGLLDEKMQKLISGYMALPYPWWRHLPLGPDS